MTLLTIVQNVAPLIGIPTPNSVVGSSDFQTHRLLAFANLEGRTLSRRYAWEALVKEATFQTVAAEEQGELATLAPGFKSIINDTIWNRDIQDFIPGPLSPQEWQALKSTIPTGPYYDYRIRDGKLLFIPQPVAGEDVYFEYRTENWCESSTGTGQTSFQQDDDVSLLDDYLIELGLRWRFLEANGLDYAQPFTQYETQVNNAMAKDGGKKTRFLNAFNLSQEAWDMPCVRAPEGSWNV